MKGLTLPLRYCALFNCEAFIHADVVCLFVAHTWHTHFPLKGIKKYLAACPPQAGNLHLCETSRSGQTQRYKEVLDCMSPTRWQLTSCLLYTSPSPRDRHASRMPSSA